MLDGLIIDSFAGGGGASTGIEMALERAFDMGLLRERKYVDFAINHDEEAIAMHTANHPNTKHLPCNVWSVEFDQLAAGRPVALMWFSPDCKHFSKAKGGKPVKKNIRDLAWVVVKAARQVRPKVIFLENVEEFQDWGPLIFKRTGDGKVVGGVNLFEASEGGRDGIPADVVRDGKTGEPVLIPDPDRKGQTFKQWTGELARLGYQIEWRELRACDYGTPTIRKRFFMIARCDGKRIAWPKPTHGDPKSDAVKNGELKPWRTAAEIIDWSLECPSIFLSPEEVKAHYERTGQRVKRPLAGATEDRVAKGVGRYVLDVDEPFIVNLTHQGGDRTEEVGQPMNTVTGAHRGEKAVVDFEVAGVACEDGEERLVRSLSPVHVGVGGRAGQSPPRSGNMPMPTLTAKADGAIITPTFVSYAQQGGGNRSAEEPLHTATASDGDQNQVVVPTLITSGYGEREGQEPRVPGLESALGTAVAGGIKHAIVTPHLTKFRANSVGSGAKEPVPTVTANSFIERPGGAAPLGVVAPHLMTMRNAQKPFNEADKPTHTITSMGAHLHLVAAFLAQHNISCGAGHPGHPVTEPVSTILRSGSHQGLAAVHMMDMHGSDMRDAGMGEPLRALTAGGFHAAQVAAFLVKYFGTDQDPDLNEPLHTVTTKDRFGLVTVEIYGQVYVIVDIGLRMLIPRELFRAQGFPDSFIIDRGRFAVIHRENGEEWVTYEWRPLAKTAQVRMCGNSVCPQLAEALTFSNLVEDTGLYVRPRTGGAMEMPLWAEDVAA